METIRKFEEGTEDIEDETSAYERLLNKMFQIDKDLPLKTEITNPIEMSRFMFIADLIENENEILTDEADLLRTLGNYVMIHYISKERKGRKEAFDSIKSYNLGQLQETLDDKDSEKFKRIMKKMS